MAMALLAIGAHVMGPKTPRALRICSTTTNMP